MDSPSAKDNTIHFLHSIKGSIHLYGGLILSICLWIAYQAAANQMDVGSFLCFLGLIWFFFLWAWAQSEKLTSCSLKTIIIWAIFFRLAFVWSVPPWEDDFYRYLWDGFIGVTEGNPYGKAPIAYFDKEGVPVFAQELLDFINHPEFVTIYGPAAELLFMLSSWIAPGKLWVLKLFFIGFDLATVFLMSKLANKKSVLFFAWCPLVFIETAFHAHVEICGVFCLVLAFYFFRQRSFVKAMLSVGGAISFRLLAVLGMLFFIKKIGVKYWGWALLTLFLCYLPFWEATSSFFEGGGLLPFLKGWEFNAGVYRLIRLVLEPELARIVSLGAFLLCGGGILIWSYFKREEGWLSYADMGKLFGLFFLFSPIVNPWYLIWLVPFVAFSPSYWGITALVVVSLSYWHGLNVETLNLRPYEHPYELLIIEYGCILFALLCDWSDRKLK